MNACVSAPCAQVQTLGFLSHLKLKGVHGPFMVVRACLPDGLSVL